MAVSKSTVRECVYCGESFEFQRRKGAQPKLCSEVCRKARAKAESARRASEALDARGPLRYELTCSECGERFVAVYKSRHLCSARCRTDRTTRLRRESGVGYQRNRSHDLTCTRCGGSFRGKPAQKFCSKRCGYEAQVTTGKGRRSVPRKSEFRRRAERAAKRAERGSTGGALVWVQGPCIVCGTEFLSRGAASRYCSGECRTRNRNRSFGLSWLDRMALFARDDWTCQICFEPVDYMADPLSDWYPSLDHIVPRSHGGSDGVSNLRTAHRWCNSVRGDLSIYTDADLQAA